MTRLTFPSRKYPVSDRSNIGYLFAFLAVLFCTLVALLAGRISREAPFLVFLPAVLTSLWYCGFRAAVFSAVLSALAENYFLTPPIYHFNFDGAEVLRQVFFIASMGMASWVIDRDRVRGEKAIAQRNKLLDSSLEPILITDIQHNVIYWNAGATRVYGWTLEETKGRKPAELLATIYPEPEAEIEQKLRTTGSWRGILIRRSKSGGEVLTDSNWTLDSESGVILQTDMDVTDRIRAERRARQSTAKMHLALDSMTDAFFVCDQDGSLVDVNEGFVKFHRFPDKRRCPGTISELRGAVDFLLPSGEPVPLDQRPVPRALRGETVAQAEYTLVCKATGESWIGSYCFAPVRDSKGQIISAVVNARDITELKRMENELVRLNRALSVISRVNQVLIQSGKVEESVLLQRAVEIIAAETGYPLAWVGVPQSNAERAVKIIASSGRQIQYLKRIKVSWGDGPSGCGPAGTTIKERRIVVVRDCASDASFEPWRAVAEEFAFHSLVTLPLVIDSEVVAVLTVYSELKEAFDEEEMRLLSEMAGDISFGISAIRDRHRAEDERLKRVHLEAQLQQAQKLEAIGTLAGGIAHDFNNLLMVIMAQLELLSPRLAPDLLPRVDAVIRSAKRAADLTSQLLAFSRKQMTQPVVTSLNHVLTSLNEMTTRLIREDIEVKVITCEDPWLVKIDRSQFEQVIMNLVVNARDAMPDGGVLTLETANLHIGPTYRVTHPLVPVGRYAVLAVSDNGVGMSPETQARIFEPFFTTKESGKGTGLGLAMVYGIVKQANGFVWVYSEVGQGTSFKIYLPAIEQDQAQEEEQCLAKESMSAKRTTVLLVEDDRALRESIQEFLESGGHSVLAAESPEEAYVIAGKQGASIEVLLTDVVLKGGNGKQLVKSIEEIGYNFKVIYMSGYTPNAIVHHGVLDPGTRFLQKPFSRADLLNMIESTVAG